MLSKVLKKFSIWVLKWRGRFKCNIHWCKNGALRQVDPALVLKRPYIGCGVMFAARPCSPGTLFYTFLPRKLPIFSFIINKFMISNFVLHNAVHKWTRKCGSLGEMTCPANMGRRRTSLHKQ